MNPEFNKTAFDKTVKKNYTNNNNTRNDDLGLVLDNISKLFETPSAV